MFDTEDFFDVLLDVAVGGFVIDVAGDVVEEAVDIVESIFELFD